MTLLVVSPAEYSIALEKIVYSERKKKKRSCILLLLDKMLRKCQLTLPGPVFTSGLRFLTDSPSGGLSTDARGCQGPHCTAAPGFSLTAVSVCLARCGPRTSAACIFTVVLSLSQMPLSCRVLLCLTVFILRLLSSDMSIVSPAFF